MYRMVTVIAIMAAVLAVAILRRRPAPSACAGTECRFPWLDSVAARACAVAFVGLTLTGFYDVLVMSRAMHGWVLLAHVGLGGAFAAALLVFAFLRAESNAPGVASGASSARKVSFWLFAASGLALILTASLAMVPWLGTYGQLRIVEFHRWAAVVSVVAAIGYAGLAVRKRLAVQEQQKQNRKKARPKAVARASRS